MLEDRKTRQLTKSENRIKETESEEEDDDEDDDEDEGRKRG